jgi:hypothetical protein
MDVEPLIDEEVAAFLQSGISMHAAGVAPGNIPEITRVAGCRITPDRRTVTVYLVSSQGRKLLEEVRASGSIAVAFTKPRTHRTVQLKGVDARVVPVDPEDAKEVDRQVAAFDADLRAAGFPDRFGWTLAGGSPLGLAAVSFTPASAFVQTPGPSAGATLKCR